MYSGWMIFDYFFHHSFVVHCHGDSVGQWIVWLCFGSFCCFVFWRSSLNVYFCYRFFDLFFDELFLNSKYDLLQNYMGYFLMFSTVLRHVTLLIKMHARHNKICDEATLWQLKRVLITKYCASLCVFSVFVIKVFAWYKRFVKTHFSAACKILYTNIQTSLINS